MEDSALNGGTALDALISLYRFNNDKKLKDFIDVRLAEIKSQRTADLTEVMEFLTSVLRGEVTETVFNPVTGFKEDIHANVKSRGDTARELLKRYPGKLDEERQKLLLEKLRAEIEDMRSGGAGEQVLIVDDIEDKLMAEGAGDDGSRD
ncbi:MAG: hypothetical protein IIW64_02355 [Selenomonadaceae bacterium]|nr:hypothetical protein [Selenomonadaceae bacterium]